MASVAAQLKDLRQQVEKLQIEVAGRQSIGAMVVWDEQNESSVNQVPAEFCGLVVHLTPALSPQVGTVDVIGLNQNEFTALKKQLARELSRELRSTEP
jgi:hypothetical protein